MIDWGRGREEGEEQVAKLIPDGYLTLLDVQAEMLEKCANRRKASGITNFTTKQSDGKYLPFEDETFDVIFLVTVFGEIKERKSFLLEAGRVLKANGVLSITEYIRVEAKYFYC